MFTVSEDHLRYFQDVAYDVPSANITVEPQDDGTTFAIMYSLLRIKQRDPNATVVFFPPDLSVPDPKTFMARVQAAVDAVERRSILILLGVEPAAPDADHQWIEPGMSLPSHENLDVWQVLGFRNAASRSEAQELIKRGALWNSSVIVGKISTFLVKLRRSTSEIHAAFMRAESTIGTPGEAVTMRRIYFSNYTESDFTRDVLMNSTDDLAVIPVPGVKVQGVARTSGSEVSSLLRGAPRGIATAIGG